MEKLNPTEKIPPSGGCVQMADEEGDTSDQVNLESSKKILPKV